MCPGGVCFFSVLVLVLVLVFVCATVETDRDAFVETTPKPGEEDKPATEGEDTVKGEFNAMNGVCAIGDVVIPECVGVPLSECVCGATNTSLDFEGLRDAVTVFVFALAVGGRVVCVVCNRLWL